MLELEVLYWGRVCLSRMVCADWSGGVSRMVKEEWRPGGGVARLVWDVGESLEVSAGKDFRPSELEAEARGTVRVESMEVRGEGVPELLLWGNPSMVGENELETGEIIIGCAEREYLRSR